MQNQAGETNNTLSTYSASAEDAGGYHAQVSLHTKEWSTDRQMSMMGRNRTAGTKGFIVGFTGK
jgi:hypothetical protein